MTVEEADWVWNNVLTAAYKYAHTVDDTPALLRSCACQWGACGWCGLGRPDRCAHRRGTAPLSPQVEDWLAWVPVFRAGKPCVWHCPGPPAAVDEQMELFRMGAS